MAVTGDQIAADALRWRGQGYIYGGTGARPGDWDCSSFVSYVLGRDLGLSLPGGSWRQVTGNGSVHGPVVESYASWSGAATVQAPQRGDLVCYVGGGPNGHIGIVLGPDQMVSALDSTQGTLVTPITGYGPPGAPIVYRRVLGTVPGAVQQAVTQAYGGSPAAAGALALLLVAAMAAAVVGLAALAGLGVAVGGTALAARMASDA